jgi:hypothetical protein
MFQEISTLFTITTIAITYGISKLFHKKKRELYEEIEITEYDRYINIWGDE